MNNRWWPGSENDSIHLGTERLGVCNQNQWRQIWFYYRREITSSVVIGNNFRARTTKHDDDGKECKQNLARSLTDVYHSAVGKQVIFSIIGVNFGYFFSRILLDFFYKFKHSKKYIK